MEILQTILPVLKKFGPSSREVLHRLGIQSTKTNVSILNNWCEQIALAENYRCSQIIQKESLRCQAQGRADIAAVLNALYVAIGFRK